MVNQQEVDKPDPQSKPDKRPVIDSNITIRLGPDGLSPFSLSFLSKSPSWKIGERATKEEQKIMGPFIPKDPDDEL